MEPQFPEKKVTLLLTDMIGFTQKTLYMNPRQVSDFLIEYRRSLENLIMNSEYGAHCFEHVAGDATASVFERKGSERDDEKSIRAFRVALKLLNEMALNRILPTRVGLYSGKVIEAQYNNQIVRFGNSFTAASRLQDLCGYFDTSILMDRDVARVQETDKNFIACVGKITPRGLQHPIHMFTIYKPGIHKCPPDIDQERLLHYIRIKNEAIEYFCGNAQSGIKPNFPIAGEKLYQAASLFKEMTGHNDIATERILQYIREYNVPTGDFMASGMKLESKSGDTPLGVQLFRLSQELLKALDREFYDTLVLNREWEPCFKLEWKEKGEVIIEKGTEPDGVYFLTKGEVHVLDEGGKVMAVVTEGDVFGEMAYFSIESVRNATVIANSDLVLYKIAGEDFVKFPAIRNLFERIAQKRTLER